MLFPQRFLFCALTVAILASAAASAAHAVVIDFQNPLQNVTTGSTFSMELRFSSLPEYLSLSSFDIEVGFNSTILAFTSAQFGDPVNGDQLNQDGLALQTVSGPYALAIAGYSAVDLMEAAASLPAIQLGEYLLATLSFSAIATGTADLWVNINSLIDDQGSLMDVSYAGTGQTFVIDMPVTSVPEPAAALLVGCGCLGMLIVSRMFGHS